MTKPSVLVIDVGTTVVKTSLFDFSCHLIDRISNPHESAGMDLASLAGRLWNVIEESVPALLRQNPGCHIAAVGITGFMHFAIPLDKDGAVIPFLLADGAPRECFDAMLSDLGDDRIFQITGSRLAVSSVPPQLLAWQGRFAKEFEKIACLLSVKDFLRYRLTGEIATDEIDACGTMLFNLSERRWDAEIMAYCGLRADVLPPVMRCTERAGGVTPASAQALGLPAGIPVAVGGGDDIEIIGSGARGPGQVCEHVGSTGSFLMPVLTARSDPERRLELYPAVIREEWVLGGSCSNVALALDWFLASSVYGRAREIDWPFVHAELAASQHKIASQRAIFLPYLSGERAPLWGPDLSAQWMGLRSSDSPADLLLSVVEGICFSLRNVLEVYHELGEEISLVSSSGGFNQLGAQRLRASIYGKPIRLIRGADPTSFATCALALCSIGELRDPREASAWLQYEPEVEPEPDWQAALDDRFRSFVELTRDMAVRPPRSGPAPQQARGKKGKEKIAY